MRNMKKLLAISIIALLTGCASNLYLVSDQPGSPINATTPSGFTVSPIQAYEIVKKEPWGLSLKHIWHIYADKQNYYIIDSFLGSNRLKALKTGIVVDGQTGKIKKRTSNKKNSE
jgi:hypothetical protein